MVKTKYLYIVILLSFITLQLWVVAIQKTGPFFDEAIYIVSGLRFLEGKGIGDGYLVWFAGSYLWPIISALGFKVAGLVGSRALAILFASGALLAVSKATENLFGSKAAFWTLLTLGFCGPFLALAHLGVYDLPALFGIAVSFWAITKLAKSDHRFYLLISALSFAFAVLSKYPVGIMLLPLVTLLIILRKKSATTDFALFCFITFAFLLAFLYPFRDQLGQWPNWTIQNKPTFGLTRLTITFEILYLSLVVLLLAIGGALVSLKKVSKKLVLVLLGSLLIWPAYHLLSGNPIGLSKHLNFGFLFAFPIIGVFFDFLWSKTKIIALLLSIGICFIGLFQAYRIDQGWVDTRNHSAYLASLVKPGDQLLINDSWPYTLSLYSQGKISSPWDVYDAYRVTNNQSRIDLCSYDWFVDENRQNPWPDTIKNKIAACKTYELVYTSENELTNLSTGLNFVDYKVETKIWRHKALENREK